MFKLAFALTLVAICTTPLAAQVGQVPSDVPESAEFVNVLQQGGIAVSRVDVRRPPVQFSNDDHAVLILTSLGLVAVEFLKGDLHADSIAVTYTYGMNTATGRMMHAYDFAQPKGNKIGWTTSDTPLYFTLHRRWFIESWNGELDTAIKRVLGQAKLTR